MDAVQKLECAAAGSVHLACTDNQKQQGTGSSPGSAGTAAGSGVGRSAHTDSPASLRGSMQPWQHTHGYPVSQLSTGATALH